jgi:hypothetical protein
MNDRLKAFLELDDKLIIMIAEWQQELTPEERAAMIELRALLTERRYEEYRSDKIAAEEA